MSILPVNLGTASTFAVLAGSTITNTGSSVLNGNLGLSPGTSVTGFPPGVVTGTQYIADTTAGQAQTDLTTAYNDAAGRTTTTTISADLGGQTLTSGVYTSSSGISLNGILTLNGQGNTNSVFIFQAGSTLITGSGSSVVLINGAQACNVFWQVGSSATLGTTTTFEGTILALTSITADTGAVSNGGLLARNGAVTLDTNTISVPVCIPVILNLVKTAPTSVFAGATFQYTLSVSNPTTLSQNVSVRDSLPAGTTFISSTSGSFSGGVFSDTPTIGAGGNYTTTLTLSAGSVTTSPLVNSFTTLASGVTDTSNITTTTITTPPVSVTPVKTAPSTVFAGASFQYTLSVTNPNSTSQVVTINDSLPSGTTFISASSGTVSGGILTDTTTIGGFGTYTNILTLLAGSLSTSPMTNFFTASVAGIPFVSNITSTIIQAPPVILYLVKTAPVTVFEGETFQYTLSVTNPNSTSQTVTISDTLPQGTTFIRSETGNFLNGVFTDIAFIPPNRTYTNTLTLSAGSLSSSPLRNFFTASVSGIPFVSNITTTLIQPTPLILTKSLPNPFVDDQSNIIYSLQVTNITNLTITGSYILDLLPNNLSFVSATGNLVLTPIFPPINNNVIIKLKPILPNTTTIILLTAHVVTLGSMTNSFSIILPQFNNLQIFSAPITSVVALPPIVTKSVSTTSTTVGQPIDYLLTIRNPNPDLVLPNVVLTDILPNNVAHNYPCHGQVNDKCHRIEETFNLAPDSSVSFLVSTKACIPGVAHNSFTASVNNQVFVSNQVQTIIHKSCLSKSCPRKY